jgi:two-component system response regulator MtrA
MPKVAIVEDDKTMLSLLQTLMEFEGFQVVHLDRMDDLKLVVETLRRDKPDLLLLDVYLDQYDGIELLRCLRGDREFDMIRILASSGRELSRECSQEGADGFIMKPYMPQELIENIHRLLGN